MFRYYSKLRPVSLGTYPKEGAVEIFNFDKQIYNHDCNAYVWGYIEYNRELTEAEIEGYELIPRIGYTLEPNVIKANVENIREAEKKINEALEALEIGGRSNVICILQYEQLAGIAKALDKKLEQKYNEAAGANEYGFRIGSTYWYYIDD